MKNRGKDINYTEESLKELILSKVINGKAPQKRDFISREYKAICRFFGSFSEGIKAVNLKPRRVENATEEELILSLQNYYKKNGKSPISCSDKGLYHPTVYLRVLKCTGWSDVLKRAGLPIYVETRKNLPTGENEIIQYARELIKKENIKSMDALLRNHNFYGADRIKSIFGNTHSFAKLVGLDYNEYGVTFDEIKEKILSIATELGRTPTSTELTERGLSDLHIRKRFGTYNEVLKKIGLKPTQEKPEECELPDNELIDIYKKVSIENEFKNGCPFRLFRELSGIGADVLTNRFGTINNLRKLCGYKIEYPSKQTWDSDSIYSFLCELTKRTQKRVTRDIINSTPGAPSVTTICRYIDKSFLEVTTLIYLKLISSK